MKAWNTRGVKASYLAHLLLEENAEVARLALLQQFPRLLLLRTVKMLRQHALGQLLVREGLGASKHPQRVGQQLRLCLSQKNTRVRTCFTTCRATVLAVTKPPRMAPAEAASRCPRESAVRVSPSS